MMKTDWFVSNEKKPNKPNFVRLTYELDPLFVIICISVYILDTGGANYVDLSRRPKEYIDDFWKFYEQMFLRMEFDAAKNNDQGIAILMDWEGFSLKNYASADGKPFNYSDVCLIMRNESHLR